jgi:hypothetical protein
MGGSEVIPDEERDRIKTYLEGVVLGKIRDRKIRSIRVNMSYKRRPNLVIEVGKQYSDLEPGAPFQQVVAIFESDSFLVCTPERGAGAGLPYYFVREDVREVKEFD